MINVIHDEEYFSVILLAGDDTADGSNFGVYNKEYNTVDVRTTSEVTAFMLCAQHNYAKSDRLRQESERSTQLQLDLSDNVKKLTIKGTH